MWTSWCSALVLAAGSLAGSQVQPTQSGHVALGMSCVTLTYYPSLSVLFSSFIAGSVSPTSSGGSGPLRQVRIPQQVRQWWRWSFACRCDCSNHPLLYGRTRLRHRGSYFGHRRTAHPEFVWCWRGWGAMIFEPPYCCCIVLVYSLSPPTWTPAHPCCHDFCLYAGDWRSAWRKSLGRKFVV